MDSIELKRGAVVIMPSGDEYVVGDIDVHYKMYGKVRGTVSLHRRYSPTIKLGIQTPIVE